MLVVTSTYFCTVIFMFHLPYMDVYFNLPISKIIHIYIYTNKRLIYEGNCQDSRTRGSWWKIFKILSTMSLVSTILAITFIIRLHCGQHIRLIFYMYMWIIFEIGRLKYSYIHVGKVKHKNDFYLLYLTRTSSVRLIAIKLH